MTTLSERLSNMFDFTKFTHQFQAIKRQILVTGTEDMENNMEHVGQLCYWVSSYGAASLPLANSLSIV